MIEIWLMRAKSAQFAIEGAGKIEKKQNKISILIKAGVETINDTYSVQL